MVRPTCVAAHRRTSPKMGLRPALNLPDINPIALAIGPLAIRWYALAYLGGVLLGALYAHSLLRRKTLWANGSPPFEPAAIWDFAFWAVLGIVIGGRTGYVLFYNLPLYLAHPLGIFALWDGGMSFHGGLVGIMVAIVLFTRSKGGNVLSSFDLLAAVAPIGLLLGRIANFINGELWGQVTNAPWGVVFCNQYVMAANGGDCPAGLAPRHPSQLYEGLLEGLVLFIVIRIVTHVFHGLRRPGLGAGIFGIGYAVSRMLVELVRVPDLQLGYLLDGWITMGQILSVPVLLAGLGLIVYAMRGRQRV